MGPCFQLSIESEIFNWICVSKSIAIHAKNLGRYFGDLPRAAHLRCTPPSVYIKVVYLHAFTHTCKRGRVVLVVCNIFKHSMQNVIFLDSKSNDQFIVHCISHVYFMWMWMWMQCVCICFAVKPANVCTISVSHLHCNGCCMFWGEYVFFCFVHLSPFSMLLEFDQSY